jgi:hypothetical protein
LAARGHIFGYGTIHGFLKRHEITRSVRLFFWPMRTSSPQDQRTTSAYIFGAICPA